MIARCVERLNVEEVMMRRLVTHVTHEWCWLTDGLPLHLWGDNGVEGVLKRGGCDMAMVTMSKESM